MRENHRVATIFAGIYTLIQAILWCIIAIYSIAVYACQASYPFELPTGKVTISYLLFKSYYYGNCRALPGDRQIEAASAARTYYWMLAYGIISAIWIPTSVLLLVAVLNKIKGNYGACLYVPWLANTAIIIIVDVAATVVYGIDISNTLTVADYSRFIKPLELDLIGADGITVVPAIELTIYFSRVIIFWILNLVLFGVVIQGVRALRRMAPTSAFVENEARVKSLGDDSSSQWVNVKTNDFNLQRLPRLQIQDSPTRLRTPFSPISPQSPISENPTPPPPPLRPLAPPPEPPVPLGRESSFRRGNSSPVYDVYGKHLGNVFPEEIHKHMPTNESARKSGLSNQVPFTYAQPVELNLAIRHAALQHREAASKPKIPNPDYTMHYQPSRRPDLASANLSRSDSNHTPSSDSSFPESNWNPPRRMIY